MCLDNNEAQVAMTSGAEAIDVIEVRSSRDDCEVEYVFQSKDNEYIS